MNSIPADSSEYIKGLTLEFVSPALEEAYLKERISLKHFPIPMRVASIIALSFGAGETLYYTIQKKIQGEEKKSYLFMFFFIIVVLATIWEAILIKWSRLNFLRGYLMTYVVYIMTFYNSVTDFSYRVSYPVLLIEYLSSSIITFLGLRLLTSP